MNIDIFILALVWAYMYNSFFGWNFSTQSPEELICDGIFAVLMAMSLLKKLR